MTEKELGKALLNLDMGQTPTPDPRHLTQRIMDRDRRRVRILTGLTALFWLVATAGVIVLIVFYRIFISPRLLAYGAGRALLENDWNDWALAGDIAAKGFLMCVLALLLAAICTVLLIILSRRATLRQINANLVEISAQLKLLRQPPDEPKAPAGAEPRGNEGGFVSQDGRPYYRFKGWRDGWGG